MSSDENEPFLSTNTEFSDDVALDEVVLPRLLVLAENSSSEGWSWTSWIFSYRGQNRRLNAFDADDDDSELCCWRSRRSLAKRRCGCPAVPSLIHDFDTRSRPALVLVLLAVMIGVAPQVFSLLFGAKLDDVEKYADDAGLLFLAVVSLHALSRLTHWSLIGIFGALIFGVALYDVTHTLLARHASLATTPLNDAPPLIRSLLLIIYSLLLLLMALERFVHRNEPRQPAPKVASTRDDHTPMPSRLMVGAALSVVTCLVVSLQFAVSLPNIINKDTLAFLNQIVPVFNATVTKYVLRGADVARWFFPLIVCVSFVVNNLLMLHLAHRLLGRLQRGWHDASVPKRVVTSGTYYLVALLLHSLIGAVFAYVVLFCLLIFALLIALNEDVRDGVWHFFQSTVLSYIILLAATLTMNYCCFSAQQGRRIRNVRCFGGRDVWLVTTVALIASPFMLLWRVAWLCACDLGVSLIRIDRALSSFWDTAFNSYLSVLWAAHFHSHPLFVRAIQELWRAARERWAIQADEIASPALLLVRNRFHLWLALTQAPWLREFRGHAIVHAKSKRRVLLERVRMHLRSIEIV